MLLFGPRIKARFQHGPQHRRCDFDQAPCVVVGERAAEILRTAHHLAMPVNEAQRRFVQREQNQPVAMTLAECG
nr:hypothetical protein MFLOJ_12170 [Mycobacterium florentinum]